MSRRDFLKRDIVGVMASLALFVAGCGAGGDEQESGGETNGGEEEDGAAVISLPLCRNATYNNEYLSGSHYE